MGGLVWQLLIGLTIGVFAGLLTGVTEAGFFALFDDLILFIARQFLRAGGESFGLTVTENIALTLAFDELVKLLRAIETAQEDDDEQRRNRDHAVRFELSLEPGEPHQFTLDDAGLLWWSTGQLVESDALADLLGVLGDAAIVF